MNELYLVLWPRHSLVIPCFLITVSFLLIFRNGRRVAGLALALPAIMCFTWYATTMWCWHSITVDHPVMIEIRPLGESVNSVILRDPAEIAQITRSFSRVQIKPACFKVTAEHRLIIHEKGGGCMGFRVSRWGTITYDVPASTIQDVFVPETPLPTQLLMQQGKPTFGNGPR